ncbi:hypothetical protein [Salmonella bongori]|uniref:hypothetical protein n=1 Tax=Salmonella bongori TaxID=54736 RepID=UPI00049B2E9C|nr:hypothetical protein [Salmonella bongori]AID27168.1 hypothetical protein N643_06655 [Salmonella bongori serovar 48:z41:-- str. RKS3044]EHM2231208.1 hypothetical protein [Salmonella bongori]EIT4621304.1 hypothetical protein [Salmonella bongori]
MPLLDIFCLHYNQIEQTGKVGLIEAEKYANRKNGNISWRNIFFKGEEKCEY